MSFEDLVATYRIDDICPEIDNELRGMFEDIFGEEFDLGIFPEDNPVDEEKFLVTVEIMCDGVTLDENSVRGIKSAVEEKLFYMLGDDADVVRNSFGGIQIILNEGLIE